MQRAPKPLHKWAFVLCSAGRCIRERSCCATRPLLTSFGRTPATGRRAPQRVAVIKRFLGFYDSRSRRRWSRAAKSKPRLEFRQRLSPPFWGARRPDAGVRPSTQCEKGGRRTIHTPSLTREPGAPRTKLGSVLLPSASEAGGSKTAAARLLKRSLSTREALPRHGSWRSCGGRSFANQKRAPPRKTHPRRKIQPPLPENLFEQQTSSSGVQP